MEPFTVLMNIFSKINWNSYERSVYWLLKELAQSNENLSREQMFERAGMTEKKFMNTLKSLAKPNKILKIPLIKILQEENGIELCEIPTELIIKFCFKEETK